MKIIPTMMLVLSLFSEALHASPAEAIDFAEEGGGDVTEPPPSDYGGTGPEEGEDNDDGGTEPAPDGNQ